MKELITLQNQMGPVISSEKHIFTYITHIAHILHTYHKNIFTYNQTFAYIGGADALAK